MIWLIIGASVIVIAIGVWWVDARAYRQGFRAGSRFERELANDVIARLRRQRIAAERHLDYLYERTRRRIAGESQ